MTVLLDAPQKEDSGIWIMTVGTTKLGLSPQSEWSLRLRGETHVIASPKDMIFTLPLLEIGKHAIYAHLQTISDEMPDIAPQMAVFPELLLLRCACNRFSKEGVALGL